MKHDPDCKDSDKQIQAIAYSKCRKGDSMNEEEKKKDNKDGNTKQDQDEAEKKKQTCPEGEVYNEAEGRCVKKTDSIVPEAVPAPSKDWKKEYDSLKGKFDSLLNSLLSNIHTKEHLDSLCPAEKLAAYNAAVATQRKLQDSIKQTSPTVPEPKGEAPPLATHADAGEVTEYRYDYGFKGTIRKDGQTLVGGRKY